MDECAGRFKYERILDICMRLMDGEIINKQNEAERYKVDKRSIQRDIDNLRDFFANKSVNNGIKYELNYEKRNNGYSLQSFNNKGLTNGEVLTIAKILLESRALTKKEMEPILEKIINGCIPKENFKSISDLIANEKYYYIEPQHKEEIVDKIWNIGQAVREQRVMMIEYAKLKNKETVQRLIKPVGIMFSEYYFYLTAFIENIDKEKEFANKDDLFPTIYRIDRIKGYKILDDRFCVPYKDRFQEGEFRKRVQFMYGGKLKRIKFTYKGLSIESVLDRLPTAKIICENNGVYTISAEVFGDGIDIWLKSQGKLVEIIY